MHYKNVGRHCFPLHLENEEIFSLVNASPEPAAAIIAPAQRLPLLL